MFKYRERRWTPMRGISGPLDHHETARHMLAADNAVTAHTRRVHFAAVTTEPVEEATEAVVRASMKAALKKGFRATYDNVLNTRFVKGTGKVTGQAVVAAGVVTGGVWLFSRMGNLSLGLLGDTSDRVDDFAADNPVAAAGLGFGLLLGVSALGIVLFRRISGGRN